LQDRISRRGLGLPEKICRTIQREGKTRAIQIGRKIQGEIEILKAGRSYRDHYETLPLPVQYDRIEPAQALDLGVARYFVPLGFRDLLAGLRPILLATAVMSGAVWAWVHLVPGTRLEDLLGGVLIGAGVYLGALFFVRRELVHHLVVSVWQALQTSEA